METTISKTVVTRYFAEIWNNRRFDLIDQLVSPTVLFHERNGPDIRGFIEQRQMMDTFFLRYPDAQFTILDLVAQENHVAVHLQMQATHAETGRSILVTGMEFIYLTNGQITETWSNWDELGLFQQIGARIVFE